jgi:tRNA(adenine34) deaminase
MQTYMQLAVDKAHEGRTPFGAVIVREGQVLAAVYNTVSQSVDPTAHAEVNAIRQACQKIKRTKLTGAVLYTTCEPCPMCSGAAVFAGVAEIYYGADIPTISRYMPQIHLRTSDILEKADVEVEVKQTDGLSVFEELLASYH